MIPHDYTIANFAAELAGALLGTAALWLWAVLILSL